MIHFKQIAYLKILFAIKLEKYWKSTN